MIALPLFCVPLYETKKGASFLTKSKTDQLSSVTNALRILEQFSNTRTVIYVSQLAKELDLSKSTVSRLVRTLENQNFLSRDTQSQGYRLGNKLLTIAGILANTNEIYREVGPVLSEIVQKTNESAQIAAIDGTDVFYIHKVSGPYYSDINTQIGMKNPIHATSTGKVLLAYSNDNIIEEAIHQPLQAFTEHTITNSIQLKKELSKVRSQGYSFSVEELTEGNYSLAFPVWNYQNRVVCALSIVGPLSRMNKDKLKDFMRILRQGAQEASERLGYDG